MILALKVVQEELQDAGDELIDSNDVAEGHWQSPWRVSRRHHVQLPGQQLRPGRRAREAPKYSVLAAADGGLET